MEYFFSSKDYQKANVEGISFFERNNFFVNFKIENGVTRIPYRSSFAVIEGELLDACFDEFICELGGYSETIEWILPPMSYPKAKSQFAFLRSKGFNINRIEINQHLFLEDKFESELHPSKRNKLNTQKKGGFETKLLDISFFDQVYTMIQENRVLKSYPMTMEREKLKHLVASFPDNFLLFGTYVFGELAACSITIKLSKSVIYQFYWAHKESFAVKNPLLFHNYKVACRAKEEGFKILDFGVSSVNGTINRGLFRYKKHLGAKYSKKYYLTYQF